MPQHTDNYELKVPETFDPPNNQNPNTNATDLHISATHASVEVLGIGGIDPDDADSPHGVGIDNQGAIDIDGIDVKPGDTLVLRLRHKRDNRPLQFKYRWTYAKDAPGNPNWQKLAMLFEETPDPDMAVASVVGTP